MMTRETMSPSLQGRALRQFTLSTGKSAGRKGRITVWHRTYKPFLTKKVYAGPPEFDSSSSESSSSEEDAMSSEEEGEVDAPVQEEGGGQQVDHPLRAQHVERETSLFSDIERLRRYSDNGANPFRNYLRGEPSEYPRSVSSALNEAAATGPREYARQLEFEQREVNRAEALTSSHESISRRMNETPGLPAPARSALRDGKGDEFINDSIKERLERPRSPGDLRTRTQMEDARPQEIFAEVESQGSQGPTFSDALRALLEIFGG